MVIAELSQEFVKRDRKLDRQEMDAKGRDSFWEKAAVLFNSEQNFDIPKCQVQARRQQVQDLLCGTNFLRGGGL